MVQIAYDIFLALFSLHDAHSHFIDWVFPVSFRVVVVVFVVVVAVVAVVAVVVVEVFVAIVAVVAVAFCGWLWLCCI